MRISLAAVVSLALFAQQATAQTTTVVDFSSLGGAPDGISEYPSVSGDGRFVAFASDASNLVAGDNNSRADIFVRDMWSSTIVCVSVDPAGGNSNETSRNPHISPDGRYVAFESIASNLVTGDTNFTWDVFVRDLLTNTTVRASVADSGAESPNGGLLGSMSDDGRFVGFSSSSANLVASDTNSCGDVFVRDLLNGHTTRVSVSTAGTQGNNESDGGSLSQDGHYVAFWSWATNLIAGDTNGQPDVFVRDVWAGTTTRVSVDGSGAQANGYSLEAHLSADGRYVVFQSYATNLVPGDTNGIPDLFERDLLTGAIVRVNVDSHGGQDGGQLGNDTAFLCGISADGRFTLFFSAWSGFVPGDTGNHSDVFVHDRVTGATSRASLGAGQAQANDNSSFAALSFDGRFVAFGSYATNLDPNDISTIQDVFLRDRGLAPVTAFCFGDGTQTTPCPCGNNGAAGRGCENSSTSGGAELAIGAFGSEPDSATMSASGLVPGALTIFLQGNTSFAGTNFGDGVRCIGGALKRLYVASASADVATAPTPGSLPLGLQSAFLGDPITLGTSRWYQAWYRDADPNFCAAPQGNLWNVSNGVRVDW
jgi:Tol biopolymer transport system component